MGTGSPGCRHQTETHCHGPGAAIAVGIAPLYSLPTMPLSTHTQSPRLLAAAPPLLAMVLAGAAAAQTPQLTRVGEGEAGIELDGFVDEAVWERIPVVDGMRVIDPDTLAEAPFETHIRMFYTERGIYVSAVNFQPPGTLVARMTSRDTRLDRDGFVVGLDTSGEGLYGYFLRMNLGDSMTDATLLPERQMNMQWDGSWSGATQALEDGWSIEYFIPWSMVALPQAGERRQIGFYFERQVGHLGGEAWSNPALPRTVNQYLSAFEKYELSDIEPRRQLTFYPFASSIHDNIKGETEYKTGSEIFWRPTTNSLLSATLNPDFGNVESDDVIVNLTAFEIFFPEKRTFFLEGQDVFNATARAGANIMRGPSGPLTLLNTRRIGGAPYFGDIPSGVEVVPTDLSDPTDLLGAVKFTGSAGNWQYGTLFATEDDTTIEGRLADGTPIGIQATGRDFGVGRLLWEDTSGGGRRSIGWMGTNIAHPEVDATVNAIDWGYFSADNRWVVDGQLMYSDAHGVTGAGFFNDVSFRPRRGVNHSLRATLLDDELEINDLGFSQRNDSANLDYSFFHIESDIPGLRDRTTAIFFTNQWNTDGRPVRLGAFFNRSYTFAESNDTARFSLRWFPPRIDDRLGRGSGDFAIPDRYGFNASYESDVAKPLSWSVGVSLEQDELGPARNSMDAGVSWRPIDRFSFDLMVNYEDREALLVHRGGGRYTSFEAHQWSPRVETSYFISARQQFRLTLQWTGLKAFEDRFWIVNPNATEFLHDVAKPNDTPDDFVISRMTFQARYRWEIAPLSDLFVVYTRGGNLPRRSFLSFQDMLEQSWNTPVVDTLAVKLRYRFGS